MAGQVLAVREAAVTLNDYQRAALRTAQVDAADPLSALALASDALGLTGEAGEVADIIKKRVGHGHPLDSYEVMKELGDVLWYLAVLSHRIGCSLEQVAVANVEKLKARYPEGFSSERSINRREES